MPSRTFDDVQEAKEAAETLDEFGIPHDVEVTTTTKGPEQEGSNRLSDPDLGHTHERALRYIAEQPEEWVMLQDIREGSVNNGEILKELHGAGAVERRKVDTDGPGRKPYEYRLKEPYRREFAQYDSLNTAEVEL